MQIDHNAVNAASDLRAARARRSLASMPMVVSYWAWSAFDVLRARGASIVARMWDFELMEKCA